MQKFIKSKLETVYSDFCDAAKDSGGLCALKDFSFEGKGSPDYSDPLVRQYYMLKFFPGYLAEYYLMYKYMFDQKFIPEDDIEILSLGFGAGVDYWGFHFRAKEALGDDYQNNITYTGYDLNDWDYRDNLGNDKGTFFENQDIGDLEKLDYDGYNVIVFPKSISDFPDETFDSFLEAVENTKFSCDKIVILCSLMTNDSKIYDNARLKRVVNVFTDKLGYSCSDNLDGYVYMKNQDAGLNTVVRGFNYSLNIGKTIMATLDKCPNYIANGKSCDNNCSKMNSYPVLKTKYVNYAIRRLTRG